MRKDNFAGNSHVQFYKRGQQYINIELKYSHEKTDIFYVPYVFIIERNANPQVFLYNFDILVGQTSKLCYVNVSLWH